MGFNRALVSGTGTLPQPMRAGVGLLANFQMKVYNSGSADNISISQLAGGHIFQGSTLAANVIYTIPTAASILASDEFDSMDIGDSYSFVVTNGQAAAFNVVISAFAGTTAVGTNNSLAVGPSMSRIFTLVKLTATTLSIH